MKFLRHLKPPTNQYEPTDCELDIPEQGLVIGRVKKGNDFVIGNKCCSTHHCTIFKDGIIDTSSNGTFVYLKS